MAQLNYGGQAVIEGVMMRGAREWAVAVRAPSGEIVVRRAPLTDAVYHSKALKLPFLRGLVMLWDSLGLGMRALLFSGDVAMQEEDGSQQASLSGPLAWGTIALALVLGIGLFFLLPTLLISLLDRAISSNLLSILAEGLVRLGIFVGYLALVGLMPDIRRVFGYHGAEHKTINAYEHGAPLTPQSVAAYPRAHTRCGTGFLLIVLVIFVLVSLVIGRPPFWLRLLSRLVLVPVVAGISYEVLKLTARYYERSALVRILVAPNLALQRLTTREPDEAMLEVAIRALQEILASEGLADQSAAEPVTPADAPAAS